jgi:hypothetical protein
VANGLDLLSEKTGFSVRLPMPEISSGMGVPDDSRAKRQRHLSAFYE